MIAYLRYKKPFAAAYLNHSPDQDLIVISSNKHQTQIIMKVTALALAFLTSTAFALDPTVARRDPAAEMEKRAVVGATVLVDGLRYRTCPKTSCTAPGQYAKGTKIKLSCYTRTDTTTVNGDK